MMKLCILLAVLAVVVQSSPVLLKHWSSSALGGKAVDVTETTNTFHAPGDAMDNHFEVSTEKKQKFEGIGGSFMRSGASVLNKMPKDTQEEILSDLFDPVDGARFTVGKVPIAATDFGVPVWYTYAEEPQSEDLPYFSIEKDLDENVGFIPLVKRANEKAGQNVRLEATLDYLPRWMLNTTTPLPDPQMNTTQFQAISNYYFKYAEAMKDQGIPLEYLSLFNEMDDSYMKCTIDNTRTLLVDYIGPQFRKEKWAPKLTWTAYPGRQLLAELGPDFMNLPDVQEYIDIIFYHGYDCNDGLSEGLGWQCLDKVNIKNTTCPFIDESAQLLKNFADKYQGDRQIWMTELCYASEFADYYPPTSGCPDIPRYDFDDGMQWGKMMFADFNIIEANAWIYWNLILDTTGGPWLISPAHNDPVKNPQQPVIIADPDTGKYYKTGCYYALWHFGRAVPGSNFVRTIDKNDVYPTISKSVLFDDNTSQYTIVLMNDDKQGHKVHVEIEGEVLEIDLSPVSFATLVVQV